MTRLTVAAELLGVTRQRPPRAELLVTLRLGPGGDEAGWVLLPDTLADPPRSPGAEALTVAAWLVGERSTLPLLRATADAGWFALLLPPGGTVTLTGLPLAWWGQLPGAVDVVAYPVTDLRLAGAPALEALGLPATPVLDHSGDGAVLADPAAVRASVSGTPAQPLRLSWTGGDPVVTRLDLTAATSA